MSIPKRKALSKRTRFEIFKRDAFRCGYCGRSPPEVLLHVDHIVAVAAGGSNEHTNLITACSDCNLGKAAVPLAVVAPSLKQQAKDAKERAEQVRAYSEQIAALDSDKRKTGQAIWEEFCRSFEWPADVIAEHGTPGVNPTPEEKASVLRFLDRLTPAEILRAIQVAKTAAQRPGGPSVSFLRNEVGVVDRVGYGNRFRYFCGVCWNLIRERERGVR